MEGKGACEDDLTHKLNDIVKWNRNLRNNRDNGASDHILDDLAQTLQYHINPYINNETPGQPQCLHKSGRPIKSIA
eukprot:SAG31_NODE_12756_length_919_cov_0.813415_1_plen_75_part_10